MAVLHDVFSLVIVAQALRYFKYGTGEGSLPTLAMARLRINNPFPTRNGSGIIIL
jgi:hypothetical protein